MLRILITIFLVNFVFLQSLPSHQELLANTHWPADVQVRMLAVIAKDGQQIRLTKNEQMQFGWESGQLVSGPYLHQGQTYQVWRIDSDFSYFLIKADDWHWYWQAKENSVSSETIEQAKTTKGQRVLFKLEYNYWRNDYSYAFSSSMFSIYGEKKWTLSRHSDAKFALGLAFRHRSSGDWSQNIPMFKAKLSVDYRLHYAKVYVQGNYYTSLDSAEPETLWEVYDEYSLLFPHSDRNFAISLVHFGSRSTVYDWTYSQAKVRAVYYWPMFFIGYEIGLANWQADDGYRTETRPLHGQIMFGNWGQNFWWKISYGDAIRRKGFKQILIKQDDQKVFTFLVGTTLNRR
ncbi:MAG: hypothetical protein ABH884_01730 [Candidatus Komeilibacteria bacterium]